MKLKEILKLIYRVDLNQPIKLCITEASGYLARYADCCKDALEFVTGYKDCEVSGIRTEEGSNKPILYISIENLDF